MGRFAIGFLFLVMSSSSWGDTHAYFCRDLFHSLRKQPAVARALEMLAHENSTEFQKMMESKELSPVARLSLARLAVHERPHFFISAPHRWQLSPEGYLLIAEEWIQGDPAERLGALTDLDLSVAEKQGLFRAFFLKEDNSEPLLAHAEALGFTKTEIGQLLAERVERFPEDFWRYAGRISPSAYFPRLLEMVRTSNFGPSQFDSVLGGVAKLSPARQQALLLEIMRPNGVAFKDLPLLLPYFSLPASTLSKITKAWIGKYSDDAEQLIRYLAPRDIHQTLLKLAEDDVDELFEVMPKVLDKLTPEAREEIFFVSLKDLEFEDAEDFQASLDTFGLDRPDIRLKAAKQVLLDLVQEGDGADAWESKLLNDAAFGQENIFGLEPSDQVAVATYLLKGAPKAVFDATEERDQFLLTWFGGLARLNRYRTEIGRVIIERDPERFLEDYFTRPLAEVHFQGDETETFIRVVEQLGREMPDLFPAPLPGLFWDSFRNRDISVGLLVGYVRLQREQKDYLLPTHSLELLCHITGLDFSALQKTKLGKPDATFYQLLLDIQANLPSAAFAGIAWDPSVYDSKTLLLAFLTGLRDLHHSLGNSPEGWEKVRAGLQRKQKLIRGADLERLTREIQKEATQQAKRKLGLKVEISSAEWQRLISEWGDLEPIFTLSNRFQGDEEWHDELFMLARVLKTSLAREFTTYKFKGLSRYKGSVGEAAEQLKGLDAKQIDEWIKPRTSLALAGQSIVLSVINSDPKLLLTVGDLVKTSSCQNYKTGGQIESLLGYVVDANVQAMASFSVRAGSFVHGDDYLALHAAMTAGEAVEVTFDGNRRIAYFEIPSRRLRLETRPFDQAYLRQMLKLGTGVSTSQPGLRLEKEYSQSHSDIESMREQHALLLRQVSEAMGARTEGENLRIPKSRNPGGIYSDLAEGNQTTAYEIP